MPNFPGVKPYPLAPGQTSLRVDETLLTLFGREVGIPRGGTVEDYNVALRGVGVRIDKKPERPYP